MGKESKSAFMLPYALPQNPSSFRNVGLISKTESPVASFPPTNSPPDQYQTEKQAGCSHFYNVGTVPALSFCELLC